MARPRALVVSVAAESFDFQDHLAPSVEAALPEVIDYIRKTVCGADSNQLTSPLLATSSPKR